jgi:hypothetical protein
MIFFNHGGTELRMGEWENGRMGEREPISPLPLSHSPTLNSVSPWLVFGLQAY